MYYKSEIEVRRDLIKKSARTAIRLKHAHEADHELTYALPEPEFKAERKEVRTHIRLKHSLIADWEINETVPSLLQEFDQRMMRGELTKLESIDGELNLIQDRKLKILDFDTECRPMAFYGGDWVTKEITAIAWSFLGRKKVHCWLLKPSKTWADHLNQRREGLEKFLEAYREADIVTGHYIRGFDLPLVNAACIELGLAPLPSKLAHDTKGDLIRMGGISKSQENLAAHFELRHPKVGMNTLKWEMGNSLVAEGRRATKDRVVGDVLQHIEFREELLNRDALQAPSQWTSGAKVESYQA